MLFLWIFLDKYVICFARLGQSIILFVHIVVDLTYIIESRARVLQLLVKQVCEIQILHVFSFREWP